MKQDKERLDTDWSPRLDRVELVSLPSLICDEKKEEYVYPKCRQVRCECVDVSEDLSNTEDVTHGDCTTREDFSLEYVLTRRKSNDGKDTIPVCEPKAYHSSESTVPPVEKRQTRQITLPDRPSLWCVDPDCCDDQDDDDRLSFGDRKVILLADKTIPNSIIWLTNF